MIIWQQHIARRDLQLNPSIRYLFSDNVARVGRAGQAAAMRGEPNAWGIATKWFPRTADQDFFSDTDYDEIAAIVSADFHQPLRWVAAGGVLVIPTAGLGTGLAQLQERSPRVLELIRQHVRQLIAVGKGEPIALARMPTKV